MAATATAPSKRFHCEVTDKARRRYKLAAWLSIPTGLLGGLIKLGWEVPFPPRTAAQNATNPPQMFLEKLGFSPHFVHQTVAYNGYDIPWVSITVHMLFSIVVGGLIYILLAEKFPQIKLWQGVAYGLVTGIALHLVLMPALGIVPAPWHQQFQQHLSEAPGHAVWMWVIELTRRDLRNRITHEPDPEVPLTAAFR